jgi:hypothetical protein
MFMAVILCLVAHSGLSGLEIPGKGCFEIEKNPLKTAVKNYVLSYFALYAAIPAVSAGFIKAIGSAPVKNSLVALKSMTFGTAIKLTKTIPVTASLTAICAGLQINKNINE